MAKLTTLQIVNEVLRNCGEATVEGVSSLSGTQLVAWNKIIEALTEICTDQGTRWQFLEDFGRVLLVTDAYRYLISGLTDGADMQREDRESFIQMDSGHKIKYRTPQEWDKLYPNGITTSRTGYPTEYMKFAGYLVFNTYSTSAENGDYVDFRYWRQPTLPATGSPSATLDIPEPFDRLVLVALASMKTLAYLGNDEALNYKVMLYGDGRDMDGTFQKLYEIYGSPELKPRLSLNA